jgi:hypothetical protein
MFFLFSSLWFIRIPTLMLLLPDKLRSTLVNDLMETAFEKI